MEEIKCEQVGMLSGDRYDKLHDISRRVYSAEGIAPTVHTMGGGQQELKILVPEATKKGYDIATYGDSINIAFPNSKTRRGRVGHGVAQTLTTGDAQQIEPTAYDEQNGYLRQDGCVGTLTTDGSSPKHNNRIVEPCITRGGTRADASDYISPDLPENANVAGEDLVKYRIRKLTERECFRLMGVKESDYEKVAKNQSTSSRYHLAGDSIVTTCLMAIFGELLSVDYKAKIQELV